MSGHRKAIVLIYAAYISVYMDFAIPAIDSILVRQWAPWMLSNGFDRIAIGVFKLYKNVWQVEWSGVRGGDMIAAEDKHV